MNGRIKCPICGASIEKEPVIVSAATATYELKAPQTLKIKLDKNNNPLHMSIDGVEIPFTCEINISKFYDIEMILRPQEIEMSREDTGGKNDT